MHYLHELVLEKTKHEKHREEVPLVNIITSRPPCLTTRDLARLREISWDMADDSRRQKLEDERTVGFIVERNPSDFAIDGPKKKRKRTIITPEQLASLNDFFNREQWPNRARKVKLAHEIGMTENFVSVWFQNKRAKIKRDIEENDKKDTRNKRDPNSLPSRQLKPILPSPPKPLCALGLNASNSTHSNSQNNICAKFSLHDDMSSTFHAKNISSNTEMAAKNVTDSVLDLSIGKVTPRFEPKCSDKFAQPQRDLAKPAQKMPVHVEVIVN